MKQIKLIVATLALILVSFATNAQFKKTNKIVEGTFSYTKTTGTDAAYSVKPSIGYFVTDRVAVGVFGEVGKDAADKDLKVGAFARCYFASVGKIKVFSQLDLSNFTETDNVTSEKTNTFSTNLGLGANYFIGSKWAVTANVSNLVSYASQGSNSSFSLGFDGLTNPFSIAKFGVLYKF